MTVRLLHIRGHFRFVWHDSQGDGLPVIERRGAYRRSIYRDPNVSRDVLNRRFVRIENAPAGPRDGLLNLQKAAGSTDGPAMICRLRTRGLGRRTQSNFRGTDTKPEARPVSATAHDFPYRMEVA